MTMAEKKMLKVRQVKSHARRPATQEATLRGLGLGRIGREKMLEDTPSVRGMIRSVSHLVKVVGE
jgi:large subunit ribosomal protein L30